MVWCHGFGIFSNYNVYEPKLNALTSKNYPCHGENNIVLESSSNYINDKKRCYVEDKSSGISKNIFSIVSSCKNIFGQIVKGSVYGLE